MIKRYFATKDNTISNAFKEDLVTRATGSNMGASDILETFSIYGQASSGSSELARILIEFDVDSISADRSSGAIPASGSVSFFLKMYDVPHGQTTPRDFSLTVSAISASWEEGYGIDMDFYKDETNDQIGSNWINANGVNFVSASATLTALSKTAGEANTRVLTVADAAGNSVNFSIDNSTATSTAEIIGFSNANSNATQFATNIAAAINAANTAETLNVVASSDGATVTLTQTAQGLAGNQAADITGTAVSDSVVTVVSNFGGGAGQWASQGGDYYTDASSSFTQSFSTGLENLEVDVTPLIEQWVNSAGNILGSKSNYGFGIQFASSFETATKSYFTKKFYGRESEFFFYRPVIEARFNDSKKDDRGNFYLSSSLASGEDNLNTIYLYNYVRGRLRNIPAIGTGLIGVSLFSSSLGAPTSHALELVADEANVLSTNNLVVTGGFVSTGVYSASVAFTGSTDLKKINDVWFDIAQNVSDASATTSQFTTGSIELKTFSALGYTEEQNYVLSMPNLQQRYRQNETPKVELYVREKNWSPNIFTVATSKSIPSLLIESGSYQIKRSIDDYVVLSYGTGSIKYSELSYDVSGNYFHLDTTILEAGYNYDLCFAFFNEDSNTYVEQPYKFKFRVVNDEY